MEHSRKNNDPKVLDPIMEKLKGGKKISMNFFKSRVIPEKLEFALLKTGYMLAFEKLGYSLMLNNCFDDVRSQILNPDKRIFTDAFWAKQAYPKEYCGVYFVMDKGCECIITIFQLDTGVSKETFCVFLPTPVRNIEEAISNIKTKEGDADQLMLELYPSPESSVDYLFDIQNIMAMNDWLNKRAEKI